MAKATTETQNTEPEVIQAPKPKNNLVHIRLNRPHGSKEDGKYVAVNGKSWLVKYDEDVYLPEPIVYALKQSLKAERHRDYVLSQL